jgi:flagellar basal body-associated protein FliL
MFERKKYVSIGFLISIVTISLLTAMLITPSVFSQAGENAIFSVSPDKITARQVPPLGSSYIIPQKLVVWNRDNTERIVYVTSEIPAQLTENENIEGYKLIPDLDWVHVLVENNGKYSSSLNIGENTFATVVISFDIPRWDNLTNQKWVVWVPVERQPLPGEVSTLRPTVILEIQTAAELPPLSKGINHLTFIAIGIVILVIIVAVAIFLALFVRKHKSIAKT